MRKHLILLVSAVFMSITLVNAESTNTEKIGVHNRYNDAVTFFEQGIKFHIFLNGDFDFNTRRNYNNYGVKIKRDRRGKVRRIGNLFINYDHRGNVKRIGNVYMNYRFGQLVKVGNLFISYDRWGNPYFKGRVKRDRYYHNDDNCSINSNFNNVYDFDDAFFYRNSFKRNYYKIKEDKNFYYYQSRTRNNMSKKAQIIKRRKVKKKAYRKHVRRNRK